MRLIIVPRPSLSNLDQVVATLGALEACSRETMHCLWIITEADRGVTTFLLPSEY